MLKDLSILFRRKVPGQLVIQFTDHCNARCPQCGMRVMEKFKRSKLPIDDVKRILDAAAQNGVKSVSFTGGEPFLFFLELVELIKHAGSAGINYIRTGTNGFFFSDPDNPGFDAKIKRIAEQLAGTPLRNFWISIDSAVSEVHEQMRGFRGVIRGIEKSLPLFHEMGIYPSANLGINRNMGGALTTDSADRCVKGDGDLRTFYPKYRAAFKNFYRFVIEMGFTMVNTCYPMSIDASEASNGLNPVYAATSKGNVVRFTPKEKILLFMALFETVPEFRSEIRIFTPMSSIYALIMQLSEGPTSPYPCRGGTDFFFVDAAHGDTYPCGYRGNENFGKYADIDWNAVPRNGDCFLCDWECFRDPSELFGPMLQVLSDPVELVKRMKKDRRYLRLWINDLRYYRACGLFNGRKAPDYDQLRHFM